MKKNEKNKKNVSQKQSTMLMLVVTLFIFLILTGVFLSRNLKGTFSATSYYVEFRGADNYNLADHGYDAPDDGKCYTDEYGYLDYNCAYRLACVCREWSTTKAGSNIEGCPYPCQATALYSNQLFTERFTSNTLYYCKGGTSYDNTPCEVSAPTKSCYRCTANGTNKYVETINTTRAATMTGGTNCETVSASLCQETPPEPEESCYGCTLGTGTEYAMATSASGAATATGGTNCQKQSSTANCTTPPQACYGCTKNGSTQYTRARGKSGAATATGGTNCTIVNDTNCVVDSCYGCTLGEGTEYTMAKDAASAATATGGTNCQKQSSTTNCTNPPQACYGCTKNGSTQYTKASGKSAAATATGGTNCTIVSDSKCVTKACYGCTKGSGTEYTIATSQDAAAIATGGTDCHLANKSYCEEKEVIPENPKTGTIGIILVWLIGIGALLYTVFYAIKMSKLK